MKTALHSTLLLLVGVAMFTLNSGGNQGLLADPQTESRGKNYEDAVSAQPKLVQISGKIDGSGRIVFTRSKAVYEHKHWSPPTNVLFDGEPWLVLDTTPPSWLDYGVQLDLMKAWIVKRKRRDTIALEQTPDGFDLHLNDSPNGGDHYEVTIAIPRRTRGAGE